MPSSRDTPSDRDLPEYEPLPADLQQALDHLDLQRAIEQTGWTLPLSDDAIREAGNRTVDEPPQLPQHLQDAKTAFMLHQSERLENMDLGPPANIDDRERPDTPDLEQRRDREPDRYDRDR